MRRAISYLDWQSAVQNRGCAALGVDASAPGVLPSGCTGRVHGGGPRKRYIRGKRLQSSGKKRAGLRIGYHTQTDAAIGSLALSTLLAAAALLLLLCGQRLLRCCFAAAAAKATTCPTPHFQAATSLLEHPQTHQPALLTMSGSRFKRSKRTPSPPEVQLPPQAPAAPSVEPLSVSLQALQQRNAELERQLLQAGVQVGVRGGGGGVVVVAVTMMLLIMMIITHGAQIRELEGQLAHTSVCVCVSVTVRGCVRACACIVNLYFLLSVCARIATRNAHAAAA